MAQSPQESKKSEGKRKSEDSYETFVVPWTNAAQFKKVYEHLFSPEVVKKRWALDQMAVWETRCHPSLPATIEASYGLTSAIVQDVLWTNGASFNQQIDIQYIYSSAITRFVNLITEIQKQYGTMSSQAKRLGIPSYIIELRNEASHSMRPSLPCLRLATETAMKFLKMKYWDVEYERVLNFVQKPIDGTDFRRKLQVYIKFQLPLICRGVFLRKERNKYKKSPSTTPRPSILKESANVNKKIESCIIQDKRLFIKILISEGMFIPQDEVFKNLIDNDEFLEFQSEEDPTAYVTQFNASIIPKIPNIHEELWYDIICLLCKHDAIPMFLESLLKTQDSRTIIGQKLLLSWVMTILRVYTAGGDLENSCLRRTLQRKGIVVDWHSMFFAAVWRPCKYTAFIIPLIFANMDENRPLTDRVLSLMTIALGQACEKKHRLLKIHRIFTVDDVRKMKTLEKLQMDKNSGDSTNNIWELVSSEEHKKWPIGHIINPIKEQVDEVEVDDIDKFIMKEDFGEKFIRFNNENDKDVSMDSDSSDFEDPHVSVKDVHKKFEDKKSFLYRLNL